METTSTIHDLLLVLIFFVMSLADINIIVQIIGGLAIAVYIIVKTFYLIKNKGKP